ncbi:MAG TPA: tRNA (N6-threonylcarbamoyladenosine(37)-N6)-methyltransferase TrmO [Chryseolinea sp.]
MEKFSLQPIGYIRSSLKTLDDCPLQESEGAPEAVIEIDAAFTEGIQGIRVGASLVLLTWFHLADRSVLKCYPRRETTAPEIGVFTTRSPDRPNPVGLHRVKVIEVLPGKLKVHPLEALDGTPVIDIKPDISPR